MKHVQHHHATADDETAMAEILDLDAEVLHSYLSDLTAWIQDLLPDRSPGRILDLGAGTGTGTFALLERFERSEVIALDLSAQLLHHLTDKARKLGLAERIQTIETDLDGDWPAIESVDLAWAASSLHHVADPDRVLTQVFSALRPGGLLVVAELESFPRFLPDDVGFGRAGLEARCHAVLDEKRAAQLPHIGSDWGSLLLRAGFTVEAERIFAIELAAPLPASAGRYARTSLRRMRPGLEGRLSAEDLATLDTLIDGDGPESLMRRDDLTVRTTRTVWVVRRP